MHTRRELFNAFRPGPNQNMKNYGMLSAEREVPSACDDDQDVNEGKLLQSVTMAPSFERRHLGILKTKMMPAEGSRA